MRHLIHNPTKERVAPPKTRSASPASPHLLDLAAEARKHAPVAPLRRAPRGLAYFKHLLDERLHLHDLRHRRVSTHHLDWKDFPPTGSRTLPHAIAITAKRFFTEHPLADLTVFTLLHLAGVVIVKVVVRPVEVTVRAWRTRSGSVSAARDARLLQVAARKADARQAAHAHAPTTTPVATARPHRGLFTLPRLSFALPTGWTRNVLAFAAIAALFTLPFGAYDGGLRFDRASVIERGTAAISMLKAAEAAAKTLDFASVGAALEAASKDFGAAREALGSVGTLMNAAAEALPIETRLTSAGPLLMAGEEASRGGAALAAGLAAMDSAATPMEKLRLVRAAIDGALPHFELASRAIGNVAPGIAPEKYRDDIELAKRELPRLTETLRTASAASATLEGLLGADGTRRYLILFQNNAELRATGGFIGSFALLDVKDGKVQTMEIPGGGSYDLQGSLGLRLNAPQPLRLINPRWEFQDSNWYPDFPTSAAQIARFYEKSGGPTVDGVIAIDATFMEKLLAVTGPVEMPEYGKTITAQNFFYETQKQVELDYDKDENKPKQFIADLAPKMLERLTAADRATLVALAPIVAGGLTGKDLLVWTRDVEAQARLAEFGWDGAMRAGDGDYLAVVHSNIAGQKTDLAMDEKIEHSAKVTADGGTVVTLTVSRTHTGQEGALFSGVRNVDYLRVYVPHGSELVEARGFEQPDPKFFAMADAANADDPSLAAQEAASRTDRASGTKTFEEHGFTVFGNWVQTDPGDTSVVTLVYRLPPETVRIEERSEGMMGDVYGRLTDAPRMRLRYSLTVQKQAGARPAQFTSRVDLPRTYAPTAAAPERQTDDRGRLVASSPLDADMTLDVIAESQ